MCPGTSNKGGLRHGHKSKKKGGVLGTAKLRKMEILRTGLVKKRILVTDVSEKVVFGRGGLRHGSGQKGGGSLPGHIHVLDIYASSPRGLYDMLRKLLILPPPHFSINIPQVNISNICRI